MNLVEN